MNKPYTSIRVLIADDHELVREGLRVLMNKIPEIEVIEEATNGEELVQKTRKLLPDVVLADVKMPKMGGLEATRIIKKEFPHIGVIALSSFDDESFIIDMIHAGARGYLLKNASKHELTEAIKAAYKDQPYYCNQTNERLALMIAKGGYYSKEKEIQSVFTKREMEVIQKICEGLSSKQIAGVFGLTTRTVERYRDTIMRKMNVNNSAAVVTFAISNGLFKSTAISK
jgi:DNA-binding NarL/FixJ family response regulator